MHRRDFLQTGIIATLAARVLGDVTLGGQGQTPPPGTPPATPPAGQPAAAAAPPTRKLIMDCYTRNLHWLRDPDQIAEAAIEMTCGGVQPTVQAYPGHIDPTKVGIELPAFVKAMQKHGLRVKQVRGGNQTTADAPNLEAMVAAMGQSGVTHYWCGNDNYDFTKPIVPQLDAIKKKVEGFVRLNQKHGTTLMYHTRAGANSVGSAVWDLLYVLKDFDPKHVGLHWDTGHMSHHGSNMWELLMRTAGPYVSAVSWKDRTWEQNLGFLGEGGPYPGPVEAAAARLVPPPPDAGRQAGSAKGTRRRARGVGAGAGVAVRRASFRSHWPVPRSRAAADGRRPMCRWARDWSISSATRECFAISISMDRWNCRRSTRTAAPRAAPTRLRCRAKW